MPSRQSPLMQQQQQRHHGVQGPRPATLRVTKADRKQQQRRPVIIYVKSPKVVHAHPSEFKSVVQRLTGAAPSTTSMTLFSQPPTSAHLQFPFQLYGGQLPLVAASSPSTTAVAAPPPPASSLPAADAASVVTSLGFFSNNDQLIISPAAFMYDQSLVAAAGAGAQAAMNPLVLPSSSLGAWYPYHQGDGDLFANQQ